MRVLVDHSGYDLRNLGDAAMLQVCVGRLRAALPDAEIGVVTTDPERLESCCAGAYPVRSALADSRWLAAAPRSGRLALEQAWKASGPYLVRHGRRSAARAGSQQTVLRAVREADLVVAAGGGYLTDNWWWHAAGVLAVLAAAQRLERPTAMFGQGLGPLTHTLIRRQAAAVLPRLDALGLRESVTGAPLARALGVAPGQLVVTGDDALELAVGGAAAPADSDILGVNVRLAGYTNLDLSGVSWVGDVIGALAGERAMTLLALPVSRHACSDDLDGVKQLLKGVPPGRVILDDLTEPAALVAAAGRCRAVVTASYHAAVFALAAGVPAVCLSRSGYYDAKFRGLVDLFPSAATLVSLEGAAGEDRLRAALVSAWDAAPADREQARASALEQVSRSRALYAGFLAPWTSSAPTSRAAPAAT